MTKAEGRAADRRVRGIADRRKAEAALLDSERKFRLLVETRPRVFGVFREGRTLYIKILMR